MEGKCHCTCGHWEGAPVYSSYPPFPPAGIMSRVRLTQAESDRLVNRLKNTNLDKFHTLCKMHLSFLLHLPGSHLDDFLGGGEISSGGEGPGTPHATPVTIEKKSHFRHFGKKKVLKEHKTPETSAISQDVIEQMLPLVKYLEENVEHEGLFRKSGHLGRQRLLSKKLHSRLDVRLELENDVYSAHDCASVLKTLLSELPEPLLTERHYLAYCQIPEMEQQPKQLQTLQLLLQLLPAENLYLLRAILSLLHKVAREPSNKMTSDTLGTMFAPHLLMPRKMSPSELQAVAGDLTRTVAFMVDNVPDLFKLPRPLIRDIATYWAQMEQCDDPDPEDPDLVHKPPRGANRDPPSGENPPITTTVTFTDRDATQHAAANTHTEVALAQLYAHVSAMPESSKKRRLLKQFTKANPAQTGVTPVPTSDKHKRTKSFGDSLKKMVGRNHKRRGSSHLLQLHDSADTNNTPYTVTGRYSARLTEHTPEHPHTCPMSACSSPPHTPVMRLFSASDLSADDIISLSAANTPARPSSARPSSHPASPRVHIVDMMKENADPLKQHKQKGSDLATPRNKRANTGPQLIAGTPSFAATCNLTPQKATPLLLSSRRRFARKSPPVKRTPDRRFERPVAFISPITRSINKAPLSVQTSVMTPGSRAPMVVLRTP